MAASLILRGIEERCRFLGMIFVVRGFYPTGPVRSPAARYDPERKFDTAENTLRETIA